MDIAQHVEDNEIESAIFDVNTKSIYACCKALDMERRIYKTNMNTKKTTLLASHVYDGDYPQIVFIY